MIAAVHYLHNITNPTPTPHQVIAAVHYLHNINVIHRDIKPENLLFVETGDELNVTPAHF